MPYQINRRGFFKTTGALGALGWAAMEGAAVHGAATSAEGPAKGPGAPHAEKLGWRLACQAYSFNRFTFFEAVAKNASLGLRCLEAYPGQKLSKDKPGVGVGPGMSAADRAEVKRKLAEAEVKLACFGVTGLGRNEADARKTFDFAKDMGIETIVSEPSADAFDLLDKLVEEYKINVALHNHPKPSPYWDPDKVLAVCRDRSKRIGACADTGHWMRSGVKPLEAIRKLEGRIISFHFKDLNQFGGNAHDVPWGTGQGNVKAMLEEIRRQRLKAVFSIEYEHNWDNSLPEIAQCVAYFDKVAAEMT